MKILRGFTFLRHTVRTLEMITQTELVPAWIICNLNACGIIVPMYILKERHKNDIICSYSFMKRSANEFAMIAIYKG